MSAVISERREPVGVADPITLDESVTMAFLAALDSMTPAERVAVILHGVFGYSFAEVAAITGRAPETCRQTASEVRRRVRAFRAPAAAPAGQDGLVRDFRRAWEAKDIDAMIDLLDPCATAVADGGGLVSAVLCPVEGDEQVARYLDGRFPGAVTFAERTVSGRPGLAVRRGGASPTAFAFDVGGNRITRIWEVSRPGG